MRKKKSQSENNTAEEIGRVMTVSLFLILLTFFILLNSIAVMDERRVRAAIGSLVGAFGSLPGGLSPLDTGKEMLPPSAPMVEKEIAVSQLISQMDQALMQQVNLHVTPKQTTLTIGAKALFVKKSLQINPALIPFLNKFSDLINQHDYPIEITGHTDNQPGSEKGYASNWELSALMAMQVLKFFESQGQIASDRLAAYGYGGHQPITTNESHASRAQNRRIDIILYDEAPAYVKRLYRKKPSGYFTFKRFDFKIY